MQSAICTASAPQTSFWAGHLLSAPAVLFLLADGVAKLAQPAPVVEATVSLGFSEGVIPGLIASQTTPTGVVVATYQPHHS